jgi:hypothetical protein
MTYRALRRVAEARQNASVPDVRSIAMILKRNVRPLPLALVLGAGLACPALAQNDAPIRPLDRWSYDNLYRSGWSAERMMDEAEVIGANGEEIGDVENIILNRQGRILGIVAEVGGFWDIGDTHVFVPWDQVRIGPDLDRVAVPVTEENVEDYSSFSEERLTRTTAGRTQVVADDLAAGQGIWKATDLIDDRAYLSDRRS